MYTSYGGHSNSNTSSIIVGVWIATIWHHVSLFTHPMVPFVVSIILVNITFSLRPDKAMLFVMASVCLILQNILFYIVFKMFT